VDSDDAFGVSMKPEHRLPGPPHLIEAAKAEAYREILERLMEIAPEVVYEVVSDQEDTRRVISAEGQEIKP
jgi:hypothetical protein